MVAHEGPDSVRRTPKRSLVPVGAVAEASNSTDSRTDTEASASESCSSSRKRGPFDLPGSCLPEGWLLCLTTRSFPCGLFRVPGPFLARHGRCGVRVVRRPVAPSLVVLVVITFVPAFPVGEPTGRSAWNRFSIRAPSLRSCSCELSGMLDAFAVPKHVLFGLLRKAEGCSSRGGRGSGAVWPTGAS
jgi:hypothetical protein